MKEGVRKGNKEEEILLKLTSNERKVLSTIKTKEYLSSIVSSTGLKEVEVMRAVQWLGNKGLIKSKKIEKESYTLGENGKKAVKEGLPERRLLEKLREINKEVSFKDIFSQPENFGIENDEINFALGFLRKREAIEIKGNNIKITPKGERALKEGFEEERALKLLQQGRLPKQNILKDLLRRKGLIEREKKKDWEITITPLGEEVKKRLAKIKTIEKLTPELIKTGEWKGKRFRHYDLKAPVPKINPGRMHFITEAINYVRKIWIELGFKEISGKIIQNAFWDLDVLFVPQDHPAREMQDTFYLEGRKGVPQELFEKISKIHEDGGETGSKGWGVPLDKEVSEKLLLRTHSTVLSAIVLSQLSEKDIPAKYFTVSKVFRNETLDWKHLFEFYQVEGIVVMEDANLSYLKGLLTEFYSKMGYAEVKIKPAYFPYTEPSAEVLVYSNEKKEWVELGGAGIFRPEVTIPLLGREIPVLAWGLGLGRILMPYFGFTDLRDLYKNDLNVLRRIKKFLRV